MASRLHLPHSTRNKFHLPYTKVKTKQRTFCPSIYLCLCLCLCLCLYVRPLLCKRRGQFCKTSQLYVCVCVCVCAWPKRALSTGFTLHITIETQTDGSRWWLLTNKKRKSRAITLCIESPDCMSVNPMVMVLRTRPLLPLHCGGGRCVTVRALIWILLCTKLIYQVWRVCNQIKWFGVY